MKYTQAPVSEVILGVTFKKAKITVDQVFALEQQLRHQFPQIEVRPPIADETLSGFRLNTEMNPEFTGPFVLRMRTVDRRWLCQIQRNKLYMNWTRPDDEPVGQYPGFRTVLSNFNELVKNASQLGGDIADGEVKYYDVTYHDRLEWQKYVDSVSGLSAIMNFNAPAIATPSGFNNVFSRYTFPDPEIGGFGLLSMNTDTSPTNSQILKFETVLRGKLPDKSYSDWMQSANKKHVGFFEEMFTEENLDKWR